MNLWDAIKSGLSAVVPMIANAIIPGSGGAAAALVSSTLGIPNTPEAISQAVANLTPDQTVLLKQAEMKHQETLMATAAANDQAYLTDVQNARMTEIARMKVTGKKDTNLYVLAWTFIIGFFVLMGFLMFQHVPTENVGPVNQLFGALAGGVGLVLGYFFGSSKGDDHKTEILADIAKQ